MGFKEDIVVNEYTGQTEYSFILADIDGYINDYLGEPMDYDISDNQLHISIELIAGLTYYIELYSTDKEVITYSLTIS